MANSHNCLPVSAVLLLSSAVGDILDGGFHPLPSVRRQHIGTPIPLRDSITDVAEFRIAGERRGGSKEEGRVRRRRRRGGQPDENARPGSCCGRKGREETAGEARVDEGTWEDEGVRRARSKDGRRRLSMGRALVSMKFWCREVNPASAAAGRAVCHVYKACTAGAIRAPGAVAC